MHVKGSWNQGCQANGRDGKGVDDSWETDQEEAKENRQNNQEE